MKKEMKKLRIFNQADQMKEVFLDIDIVQGMALSFVTTQGIPYHLVDSSVNQRRSGSLLNFTKFVMIPESWAIKMVQYHILYEMALQKETYVTQTPSSRSFVVRFTHGSVFITASNLTIESVVLRKVKKEVKPGLWNPDVWADGDSRKVNVRYRRVGRLNLLGAFSNHFQYSHVMMFLWMILLLRQASPFPCVQNLPRHKFKKSY